MDFGVVQNITFTVNAENLDYIASDTFDVQARREFYLAREENRSQMILSLFRSRASKISLDLQSAELDLKYSMNSAVQHLWMNKSRCAKRSKSGIHTLAMSVE